MNTGWTTPALELPSKEEGLQSRPLISRFTIVILSLVSLGFAGGEPGSLHTDVAMFAGVGGWLAYLVCSHFAAVEHRKALKAAQERVHERLSRFTNQRFARLITVLEGPGGHGSATPVYVRSTAAART